MAPEFSVDLILTAVLHAEPQDIMFKLVRDGWQTPGWINNGHAGIPQPFSRYDLHIIRIFIQEGAQSLADHAAAAGGTIAMHNRKWFPRVLLDPAVVELGKLC